MNYRHIYHAGNFADVVKHAVLARVVDYLKRKEGAFRVIDTHAGIGVYDLSSTQAQKTGEWRDGIGRLMAADLPQAAAGLLKPYLDAVRALNASEAVRFYPGSPAIARHLLRRQDRLTAIELHPADAERLKARFAGDFQTRVIALDGWLALGAHVPPKERRGLVIVDPPFEAQREFDRMLAGLVAAHRRWAGGTYLLWYPIKDRAAVAKFRKDLSRSGIGRIIDVTLEKTAPGGGLAGTGLIVVNPPFTLADELATLLPVLADVLGPARFAAEQLSGEI